MSVHDADYAKVKEALGIPENEPIFILRAKDDLALHTVTRYRNTASSIEDAGKLPDDKWFHQMDQVISDFANFRLANPDKMKVPD